VLKQLLRHGHVFREGKTAWTLKHRRWINAQRLADALAHVALEQMLIHLDGIERQLDMLDAKLEQIAAGERWAEQVQVLTRFRGISTLTALGLIAEIGDFARFSHPRELASWLGITPSEYSRAISSIAATSPRPATTTPDDSWSRPPGITATHHGARRRARSPTSAPGRPRCVCISATAISPSTASAQRSSTSPSPASSSASSGPR
jgi:hypothetical protein